MPSATESLVVRGFHRAILALAVLTGVPPAAARAPVEWHFRWEDASARAATRSAPLAAFAVLPGDGFSRVMEERVWDHPEVLPLLPRLVLLHLDVSAQAEVADRLQISATPSLLLFTADGRELQRRVGLTRAEDVAGLLRAALAGRSGSVAASVFDSLEVGEAPPPTAWPELLAALGDSPRRVEWIDRILALAPFPSAPLVDALAHPDLATRAGALDVLEQAAGEDFGLDPWEAPPAPGDPSPALDRWRAWAEGKPAAARFSAFTAAQVERLLEERLGTDPERRRRAGLLLAQGGPAVAEAVRARLERTLPPLGPGEERLLRETFYTLRLAGERGTDPAILAKTLTHGSPDAIARALRDLQRLSAGHALGVAAEFLTHPAGRVREAAVETTLVLGQEKMVPDLEQQLAQETDREVLVTYARALRGVPRAAALPALGRLVEHPDEDVVITALGSLGGDKEGISNFHFDLEDSPKAEASPAEPLVLPRLADGRWRVRAAAVAAARDLKLTVPAERVESLLADPDSFVRFQAIQSLPRWIPDGAKVAPRMLALLQAQPEQAAVVVSALLESRLKIAPELVAAVASLPAEQALPALQIAASAGQRGLPFAQAFVRHPNPDFQTLALKFLAAEGLKDALARRVLLDIIQGEHPGLRLTVVEALDGSELRPDRDDDPRVSAPAADDPHWQPLFTAFGLVATDPFAPLVAAFGLSSGPAAGGRASLSDLRLALTRLLEDPDPALSLAAAAALAESGHAAAITQVTRRWGELPASRAYGLLSALNNSEGKSAAEVELLLLFVDSGDERLRKGAASALGRQARQPSLLSALVDGLLAEPPRWDFADVDDVFQVLSRLKATEKSSALAQWRRLWADPTRTDRVVFGLYCAGLAWTAEAEPEVVAFTTSADPLVRRAAWQARLAGNRADITPLLSALAADSHPLVRELAARQGARGVHITQVWIAPGRALSHYQYSSSSEKSAPLPPAAAEIVTRLASDPDPDVRVTAMLRLWQAGGDFDAPALMAALAAARDSELHAEWAKAVLAQHSARLNARHAALAPLFTSKSSRDIGIRKRLQPAAPAPSSMVAVATPTLRPDPTAPAEFPTLRVLLFHRPGCDDCATARRLLAEIAPHYAEWKLEDLDIETPTAAARQAALVQAFGLAETQRGKAPSVFMAAGGLVAHEITGPALAALAARSHGTPFPGDEPGDGSPP